MKNRRLLITLTVLFAINGIMFMLAWFGGDIIMNNGYSYMRPSFDAIRLSLAISKACLACGIFGCLVN